MKFVRRLNFQIHLWIGILLTLYLVVIGLTGSILVFRVELERLSGLQSAPTWTEGASANVEQVLVNVRTAYPDRRIVSVLTPNLNQPLFLTTIQGPYGRVTVRSDPHSGAVVGLVKAKRSWLDFVADLHTTWLLGIKGRIANGVGAALLLIVSVTGLVIWWPGLSVDLRRRWRRINFDLHRSVGFWTLPMLGCWAVSGIYFGWPRQFFDVVNRLSPIVSARPPEVRVRPVSVVRQPKISTMIASAYALDPGTTLAGVIFPYSRRAPYEILMQRRGGTGREYSDTLYFSPWDGSHLMTWRYGVNESLGDWIIWLQTPLHFGTFWGLGVKILWAVLGMALPLLAVTGAVMYWNRVLRRLAVGTVYKKGKTGSFQNPG